MHQERPWTNLTQILSFVHVVDFTGHRRQTHAERAETVYFNKPLKWKENIIRCILAPRKNATSVRLCWLVRSVSRLYSRWTLRVSLIILFKQRWKIAIDKFYNKDIPLTLFFTLSFYQKLKNIFFSLYT